MTARIIPFPFNDEYRPDEQRARVAPPTPLMEERALYDAAALYRDAGSPVEKMTAIGRMMRLLRHGSPPARSAADFWRQTLFGPPIAAPALVDYDPFSDVPGGADGGMSFSDYAD